jgi:SanA protein
VIRPSVRRRILRWGLISFVVFALLVLGANRWIINSTKASLYRDMALLPEIEVGLVLGTSHRSRQGGPIWNFRAVSALPPSCTRRARSST